MHAGSYRIRRATIDDLPQLKVLWGMMGFTTPDLDKGLTEFQIAETAAGQLIGAIALQVNNRQGLIHSEAFADFTAAEAVRPLLWERLQSVAGNFGLVRLWTREESPFWGRCGFVPATDAVLPGLPEVWRPGAARWLTLVLREETAGAISVEREFELFMAAERQRTQATLGQAQFLKTLATLVAIVLGTIVAVALLYLWMRQPQGLTP